jgi:hypothetical protein
MNTGYRALSAVKRKVSCKYFTILTVPDYLYNVKLCLFAIITPILMAIHTHIR